MNAVYARLILPIPTGNLKEEIYQFLLHNHPAAAEHCMEVGEEAGRIANRYGADVEAAQAAGYLHDISAVFPNSERIRVAVELGIEVLPEEEVFPMIIHQKISKAMARDLFHIQDEEILDAVGCHTTLREQATSLDKVLFVADKIRWDQSGTPPYLDQVKAKLEHSLDAAAFEYIRYLWQRRESLKVLHPWLEQAYYDLKQGIQGAV
ncbi:bis(5'-nucleosyl)-tetraphosphatase (symmetrical) YqeK [Paenibacillus sp. FJAT-26967]|uniref:bis(5'-nucleosyl)-tetraphosphatase (symmetrical) YqeK n=1 Tax=Paenibacillus sp. FJAT-26967 TaxID=1729690 RepID=UPI0008392F55|nr:bis(5'-nucleosyl)-tetraphosphatase (symmetrical) YqeK [Paenibacillus sp. FJAT-26967]